MKNFRVYTAAGTETVSASYYILNREGTLLFYDQTDTIFDVYGPGFWKRILTI